VSRPPITSTEKTSKPAAYRTFSWFFLLNLKVFWSKTYFACHFKYWHKVQAVFHLSVRRLRELFLLCFFLRSIKKEIKEWYLEARTSRGLREGDPFWLLLSSPFRKMNTIQIHILKRLSHSWLEIWAGSVSYLLKMMTAIEYCCPCVRVCIAYILNCSHLSIQQPQALWLRASTAVPITNFLVTVCSHLAWILFNLLGHIPYVYTLTTCPNGSLIILSPVVCLFTLLSLLPFYPTILLKVSLTFSKLFTYWKDRDRKNKVF